MYILGITAPISWNNAAALIQDGNVIAAAEEERFNRVKHAPRTPPIEAIKFCLDFAKIDLSQVDTIAVGFKSPLAYLPISQWTELRRGSVPNAIAQFGAVAEYAILLQKLKRQLAQIYGEIPPTLKWEFIPHHIAHAASAYYVSGFDKANIISLDGNGEDDCGLLAYGQPSGIDPIHKLSLSDSIGELFGTCTDILGFRKHSDEGKTMGLAAFGSPQYLKDVVNFKNGAFTLKKGYANELWKEFGPRRPQEEALNERHKDLAASVQSVTEQVGVHLAQGLKNKTKSANFCLAGGVALNCDMNAQILLKGVAENIFVQPAAHDAGTALGAAYEVYVRRGGRSNFVMDHASWGPEYTNEEIEHVLRESKLEYTHHRNIEEVAAESLKNAKILGWFQGRMEWGPRALGNRSILANPAIPQMKEKVNREVKHRENWRPFAPAILAEEVKNYADGAYPSPFMLLFFHVFKEKQKDLAAGIHIDGTARVQSVTEKANPTFYRLLQEMQKKTGVPSVVNTSFNDRGEPIVMSPRHAVRTFFATGLDELFIGNYRIVKPASAK